MRSPQIDLFGIAHVKVEFIPVLKIYTIPILGIFYNVVYCEESKYMALIIQRF